jgi:hypothetical protein
MHVRRCYSPHCTSPHPCPCRALRTASELKIALRTIHRIGWNQLRIFFNLQPKLAPDERTCERANGPFGFSAAPADGAAVTLDRVWVESIGGARAVLGDRSLSVSDYDLDGYIDLLMLTRQHSADVERTVDSRVSLLRNVPCTESTCALSATRAQRRTFERVSVGVDELTAVSDAVRAAFFDIDDDGVVDVVLEAAEGRVRALLNNYDRDSYFLKVLSLNGVCASADCNVAGFVPYRCEPDGSQRVHRISSRRCEIQCTH